LSLQPPRNWMTHNHNFAPIILSASHGQGKFVVIQLPRWFKTSSAGCASSRSPCYAACEITALAMVQLGENTLAHIAESQRLFLKLGCPHRSCLAVIRMKTVHTSIKPHRGSQLSRCRRCNCFDHRFVLPANIVACMHACRPAALHDGCRPGILSPGRCCHCRGGGADAGSSAALAPPGDRGL